MNLTFEDFKRRRAKLNEAEEGDESLLRDLLGEAWQAWRQERGCPSAEVLGGYFDNLLPSGQKALIQRHIRRCRLCRSDLSDYQKALRPAADPRPARSSRQGRMGLRVLEQPYLSVGWKTLRTSNSLAEVAV